ncbi:Uncharacterised protein [uncultured archaeon]|nr:Uncharacterised protein [uncultured archaeon]
MRKNVHATLKASLLKKLRRRDNWGESHTSFDDLPRGFRKDLRGSVKDIAEELIKEGLLLSHPTSYGTQVSLNPKKKAEIDKIIKEVLSEEP